MAAITPASSASSHSAQARSWRSTAIAAGAAAVVAVLLNSVIAWAAHALFDIPDTFRPLTPPTYVTFTVAAALIGAIGWHLIAARARHATRLLNLLALVVLVLSLIPDLLLLADTSMQPGTTTAGVVTLMLMHLAAAVTLVAVYRRFIPAQS
jgi:uncharacterized membrane protein YtjA (UPF0391 family)